jgi:hypothetical protein
MAIARSGTASVGSASAFTLTISHDAGSGSERFLMFAMHSGGAGITSVTYAGVPMTMFEMNGGPAPYTSLWGLANPTVGTNDLVVSASGIMILNGVVQCYTGMQSSTTPDSSSASTDNAVFTTSLTMSTTVVDANAWTFYAVHCTNSASAALAGTGSSIAGQNLMGGNGSINLFDSNATVGSGAESMQATHGSASNWRGVMLSMAPGSGVVPSRSSSMILMGIG